MDKIKIAVTGGIGSGKSTVLRCIAGLGYDVFSCDEIYKEIYATEDYQRALADAFPSCVAEGEVDKKRLSALVFNDKQQLNRLNQLAHGRIMQTLLEKMSDAKTGLVFAEVPLLFEGGYDGLFDFVFVVLRDKNERLRAVCSRDGLTPIQAAARLNNQWDYDDPKNKEFLINRKFIILHNDGKESEICQSVREAIDVIMKQYP